MHITALRSLADLLRRVQDNNARRMRACIRVCVVIHSTVLGGKAMKKFTKMELLLFCFSVCLIKVFHFAEADGIFFGSDTNVFQKFSFCFMAGEFHYCKQVHPIQIHECSTCTTSGMCGDEGIFRCNSQDLI